MHLNFRNTILAALLCCAVSTPCAQAQEDVSQTATALTVELVKPVTQEWPETVSASGWLLPWQEAVVSSEVGGLKVSTILVDVGSLVRKGDTLAELSSESVLADIQKQQAAIGTAQANLDEADANVERARQLDGSGALSGQTKMQYLIAQRTAQASLASEKAGLASEKIKLAQTRIIAVDDGIISSRSATLGAVVSSGTEMFRLIRQQRIEWQAEVPSNQLSSIREGQATQILLPDASTVQGSVRLVSPTVNKNTGRALIFVALPGTGSTPGQFVSGSIDIGRTKSLAVPQTSIVQRDGMTYVFVMADHMRVERKRVETGRRQKGLVEIKTGIVAGSDVVKSGGAFLADGASVKVVQSTEIGE
ncbi:efflux RND transporter periplasmic adaptor subunit [Agrobacterium sp. rho-13.3]|uniref:efflux RND transporter periplasmic adaptor subunit n=1 Tax=Agrobacterium sp. rho-13.3 TaxID=3072980 RepID=UPI0039B765ED